MNISAINSANSNPNFKGYIDPKLVNLIKTSANGTMKSECAVEMRYGMRLRQQTLRNLKYVSEKSDEILSSWDTAVKDLHPDTRLTYTYRESRFATDAEKDLVLELVNDKIGERTKLGTIISYGVNNHDLLYDKGYKFRPDKLEDRHLGTLFSGIRSVFDKISLTPKKMKEKELEMFISYTDGGLIRSRREKKANELAPEFGLPSNWSEVLRKQRNKEKLERQLDEQQRNFEKEKIKSENADILDKFFK